MSRYVGILFLLNPNKEVFGKRSQAIDQTHKSINKLNK